MIRINLSSSGSGSRRHRSNRVGMPGFKVGLFFGLVYVLVAAGVGGYWLMLDREETRLRREVDRGNQELTVLKATIAQGTKVKEQLAELKKRVEAIDTLTQNQGRPIRLLDAFVGNVPRDLWITGLEEKSTVLKISGSAFSTTAVADLMSNLKSSGKFKDVDIVISKQDIAKTPRIVTFEVTCRFES